jgi:trimeric autotransporter adhesin
MPNRRALLMKSLLRLGLFCLFLFQLSFICFAQSEIISTVAGSPLNGDFSGCVFMAGWFSPAGIVVDSSGNLYIGSNFNACILKMTPGGTIRNFAGNGTFGYGGDGGPAISAAVYYPSGGLAMDSSGSIYIADIGNWRIRKVTPDGIIVTVAGNGNPGYSGDGGLAISAEISWPNGVAVDSSGNLYIADSDNHHIRKVTPDGIISTVAGNGTAGYSGDGGPAASAALNSPGSVAVDSSGNLYIADYLNNRIRKVTPDGIISTVAGNGIEGFSGDGGSAITAAIYNPWGVAVDSSGNLYIADAGNSRVRKVTPDGIISTIAGNGSPGYSGDGGSATSAEMYYPSSVALDSSGNLYIVDDVGFVRKVTPDGIISTVFGAWYSGDGGSATSAEISGPFNVAVDSSGNLYFTDANNNRIRKVTPGGIISTVAGNNIGNYGGDSGSDTDAMLAVPTGLAMDSSGNLYVSESCSSFIKKVTADGIITTVAGNGAYGYGGDGGPATSAQIKCPYGVAMDSSGNLFIADTGNHRIRKVNHDGIITTVAGDGIEGHGGDGGPATSAEIAYPYGVAVDISGNLYIADAGNSRIRKVTPDGIINTVAGNGTAGYGGDGGSAASAQLQHPYSVAVDSSGSLFIADTDNNRIRKVTPDGIINTIVGNGTAGYGGDGGPAISAKIFGPTDVAVDSSGNLYIADSNDNRIRKVSKPSVTSYLDISAGGAGQASTTGVNPDTQPFKQIYITAKFSKFFSNLKK